MAERAIGENSLLSLKELDEAFSGLYVKLHDGLECIHSSRQGALIILFVWAVAPVGYLPRLPNGMKL